MHEVAAGPPAHHYGSEMHPHMIVDGSMVGGGIGTELAIGVIGLNSGGDSIHNVGFPRCNLDHGRWTYYIMQPDVLLFPVFLWSQSIRFPSQSMSTCTANSGVHLSSLGIPCTIGKVDLINPLSLCEAFCRFISIFGNTG